MISADRFLLLSEKCSCNSARACMGANHTAHHRAGQIFQVPLPESRAVLDILLQQGIAQSGIAQQHGLVKIHTAGFCNFLDQQIVGLSGAPGFTQHFDFPVFNVADSFVCVGAGMLILYLILDTIKECKDGKKNSDTSDS